MTTPPRRPLVTRNPEIQGGKPCLRGTRFPVDTLYSWEQSGYDVVGIRAQYAVLRDDFTVAEIETAMTYPRLPDGIPVVIAGANVDEPVECYVFLHYDGTFAVDAWYAADDAPALIAAIEQAQAALVAWVAACDAWEADHRGEGGN